MYLLCTESMFESDLFSRKREKVAQNVAANGNFSIFWKQRIFFKLLTKNLFDRKNETFILKIKNVSPEILNFCDRIHDLQISDQTK